MLEGQTGAGMELSADGYIFQWLYCLVVEL